MMNVAAGGLAIFLSLLFLLAGLTRIGAWQIERDNPAAGNFAEVNGTRMHYVHVPASSDADLPPLVFIHGASGNLNDPMNGLRRHLESRAELLFIDRPGHGWSERGGSGNARPDGQAATIAALMDHLGIERAIIVGHSFGGSVAAAFGVTQPEKTAGLLFLAAATHPWPGGGTSWYYELTAVPVIGWLFAQTMALPAGKTRLEAATACVFAPNEAPPDYSHKAAIPLVLRPNAFRANAEDVAGLFDFVSDFAVRYREIEAPTVVISGNRDTVVFEEIHSTGLARDIKSAELVWVDNLGHKPDYVAPELVAAAIEKIAGRPSDLAALARVLEAKIAEDRFGPIENCPDEKPEMLAPQ